MSDLERPRTLDQVIARIRIACRDPEIVSILIRIDEATLLCDAAQRPREEDTFGGPRPNDVTRFATLSGQD